MAHFELWQVWCISGILFLIVELFTPTMFFLNLSFACFLSGLAAYFGLNTIFQVIIFCAASAAFLLGLRPILYKNMTKEDTGFEITYIGKTAKVVEEVTPETGRVSLYGEEWQARTLNGETIPPGKKVKIVKNESIIMFVEQK